MDIHATTGQPVLIMLTDENRDPEEAQSFPLISVTIHRQQFLPLCVKWISRPEQPDSLSCWLKELEPQTIEALRKGCDITIAYDSKAGGILPLNFWDARAASESLQPVADGIYPLKIQAQRIMPNA